MEDGDGGGRVSGEEIDGSKVEGLIGGSEFLINKRLVGEKGKGRGGISGEQGQAGVKIEGVEVETGLVVAAKIEQVRGGFGKGKEENDKGEDFKIGMAGISVNGLVLKNKEQANGENAIGGPGGVDKRVEDGG